MTYGEMLAHIFSRGRFGMKPGLERILLILERLGNPHRQLATVQIAGTNGKGSTGAFLSAILTAAGCRVAFFSSPHLVSFNERFRLNDADVPDLVLEQSASRVLAVAPAEATFFEIVTAIAFCCFAAEQADLAIMETGMGGRWDATNVADGLLSIITPVGLDHCEYLGGSLAAIAAEKAGIIKPAKPVVIAGQQPEALQVLLAEAGRQKGRVFLAGRDYQAQMTAGGLDFTASDSRYSGLQLALLGRHQAGNAAAAIMAAELLRESGIAVTDQSVRQGVAAARWPGRLELLPGNPPVLLDGAHNPAGAVALRESLMDFPCRRLVMVIGVMADKAWPDIVRTLLPAAAIVIAVRPALDRALPPEVLAEFCRDNGGDAVVAVNVAAGLDSAKTMAGNSDLVLVTGSLFTVGEARAYLAGGEFAPIRG